MSKNYSYKDGFRDGIAIGLGYLPVSFGFGISAAKSAVSLGITLMISMTNLTSAGQVAGLGVIIAGGTLLEIALTQLVINIRYSLMGLTLTQKLDDSFTTPVRLMTSFFITDEIYAVASSKTGLISKEYMFGLGTFPYIGWALGTFLGASAGAILPESISNSLGIAIYAMFVAIIVPPSIKSKGVLLCVSIAAILSIAFKYISIFNFISSGFAIVICAIVSAVILAVLMPVEAEDE